MNNRELSSSILIPNLVILLLVAFGIISDQTPLVSLRPSEAQTTATRDVPARLWQDPLGIDPPPDRHPHLKNRISASRQVLILPVLLNGSAYAEEVETRLRTRYAVLSALSRAQYLPDNPDRMLFLEKPGKFYDLPIAFEEFVRRPLVTDGVVFEQDSPASSGNALIRISKSYTNVLVLWLDENRLSRASPGDSAAPPPLLKHLDQLLGKLLPAQADSGAGLEIKILGPATSSGLVELARRNDSGRVLRRAEFLSARATAATTAVQIAAYGIDPARHEDPFSREPWPVKRTITTDDHLVDTLLNELSLRGASPGAGRQLVLVGEWDSFYSRALGRTIAAKLNSRDAKAPAAQPPAAWSQNPPYFYEFSYLLGLDGKVPHAASTDQGRPKPNSEQGGSSTTERAADPTRASGPAQLDYLRRLEDRLQTLQAELQHGVVDATSKKTIRSEIGAIGVVGSDAYDKLIVLRALRRSFPRAVFFTTDLDAAYLDREEREWTRNLLIVAPYGLRAADHLQGRTPPFRDSYQTALYLTCLHALNVREASLDLLSPGSPPLHLTPRIFEIGRSRIFDLSAQPEAGTQLSVGETLHPPPHRPYYGDWFSITGAITFVLILAVAAIWMRSQRTSVTWRNSTGELIVMRDSFARYAISMAAGLTWFAATAGLASWLFPLLPGGVKPWFLLLVVATSMPGFYFLVHHSLTYATYGVGAASATIMAALAAAYCLFGGMFLADAIRHVATAWNEEPFAFFEGVSVWPTNIVRGLLIAFSLHFLLRAQFQLTQLKSQIAHVHGLTPPAAISNPAPWRPRGGKGNPGGSVPAWARWRPFLWFNSGRLGTDRHGVPAKARLPAVVYPDGEDTLWQDFCRITTFHGRLARIGIFVVIYFAIFSLLSTTLGSAISPVRGELSRGLDRGVLIAAVLAFTFLLFYVFDATLISAEFCRRLTRFIGEISRLQEAHVVHLIDDLAAVVTKLIYLPFSVLFMFVASRNALFDRWDWPAVLVAIFSTGLLLIIVSSVKLQRAATEAKRIALQDIDQKLELVCSNAARALHASPRSVAVDPRVPPEVREDLKDQPPGWIAKFLRAWIEHHRRTGNTPLPMTTRAQIAGQTSENQLAQVETLEPEALSKIDRDAFARREAELREQRRQIEAFNGTAFQHWYQNPIFRALLIPLGGFGSLQLLENLVTNFAR